MEYIRIFIRVTCVLIIVGNVHCESIQELLSKLSEKFDNIDQSYEKRLGASINKINERLDRIENVLGINDQDLEGIRKSEAMWKDIQNTKHKFKKAFKNEKQQLDKVVSEYEGRFEELKQSVKDMMSQMNDTVVDTEQKVNEKLLQNSNNFNESFYRLETKTNEQFREFSSKINNITQNNTRENMDMALYKQTIDDRFISLAKNQSQQDTNVRSYLNESVSSLRSSLSKQGTKVENLKRSVSSLKSSLGYADRAFDLLRGRIDSLEETKVAFTVYLKSTIWLYDDQIIIFDGVIYNHGRGYSARTGVFTAPKSGTYLFSISVEGTNQMKGHANIVTYQQGYKNIWAAAHSLRAVHSTASNSMVYYLYRGEQVWAESEGSSEFLNYRTEFTGALLD